MTFPIEEHQISVTPDGTRTPVIYRYQTIEQRDRFDEVRRKAYNLKDWR